jgi:hypothetical protein
MKPLLLAAAATWLTLTPDLTAQVESEVKVGRRLRVAVTDSVLRSPYERPGRLRQLIGTVVAIEPDTLRMAPSPTDPPVAIPRILIYKIELSRGHDRKWAAGEVALMGGGLGAIASSFLPDDLGVVVFAGGYVLGALIGAVVNHERWVSAWLPE